MELRIKEIIKEKGLTIKEVAQKMGISPSALSLIVNGNPTTASLLKIAEILEVNVTELFPIPETQTVNCPYCGGKIKVSKE